MKPTIALQKQKPETRNLNLSDKRIRKKTDTETRNLNLSDKIKKSIILYLIHDKIESFNVFVIFFMTDSMSKNCLKTLDFFS